MLRSIGTMLGLAALPASPVSAQAASEPRTVVVSGYGEVETMPDLATVSYTLRGEGQTSDEAVKAMSRFGQRIEQALHHVDTSASPKTDDVQINPVKGPNCKDRDYDAREQLSKGPCAIIGYIATQTVTARFQAVKDAGTIVGVIGREGGYNAGIKSFELADPRLPRQQAIAIAVQDAASKAAAVASASHLVLGAITNVVTAGANPVTVLSSNEVKLSGTTRTEDLINGLPQAYAKPVVVDVNPQPITMSAALMVTYAITQ